MARWPAERTPEAHIPLRVFDSLWVKNLSEQTAWRRLFQAFSMDIPP